MFRLLLTLCFPAAALPQWRGFNFLTSTDSAPYALRPPSDLRLTSHFDYLSALLDKLKQSAETLKAKIRYSYLLLDSDSGSMWIYIGAALFVSALSAGAYLAYRYLKWIPEKRSYREIAKSRSNLVLDSGLDSAGSPQNKSAFVVYVSPGESSPDGVKRKSKYKTRSTSSFNNSADATPANVSR